MATKLQWIHHSKNWLLTWHSYHPQRTFLQMSLNVSLSPNSTGDNWDKCKTHAIKKKLVKSTHSTAVQRASYFADVIFCVHCFERFVPYDSICLSVIYSTEYVGRPRVQTLYPRQTKTAFVDFFLRTKMLSVSLSLFLFWKMKSVKKKQTLSPLSLSRYVTIQTTPNPKEKYKT